MKILYLFLLLTFTSVQAMEKNESFRMIQNQLQSTNSDKIAIIVELKNDRDTSEQESLQQVTSIKSDIMAGLSRLGQLETRKFNNLPIMAMQVNEIGLQELEKNPNVVKVYQNKLRKQLLNNSTVQVQANLAWANREEGAGVTIAIVDAGFSNFTYMFDAPGKVPKEACFTSTVNIGGVQLYANCWPNNTETAFGEDAAAQNCNPCADGNDHGSLVAGVAAGNSTDFGNVLRGVAIESSVIAVNVFSRVQDQRVCGFNSSSCVVALDSDVLAGLDYVYSQRELHDIAAVNLSLGSGAFQNECDNVSVYTSAINRFKESNIAVVAAAGNAGSGTSIIEPACVSNAIAVGSIGTSNNVSVFSNSNSLVDFWAPGEDILTDSGNCLNCWESVSGTSFSAPHVTGAFAILRSYNKNFTVDQIKGFLSESGLPITDPLNGITRPMIQINDALNLAPRPLSLSPLIYLLLED